MDHAFTVETNSTQGIYSKNMKKKDYQKISKLHVVLAPATAYQHTGKYHPLRLLYLEPLYPGLGRATRMMVPAYLILYSLTRSVLPEGAYYRTGELISVQLV